MIHMLNKGLKSSQQLKPMLHKCGIFQKRARWHCIFQRARLHIYSIKEAGSIVDSKKSQGAGSSPITVVKCCHVTAVSPYSHSRQCCNRPVLRAASHSSESQTFWVSLPSCLCFHKHTEIKQETKAVKVLFGPKCCIP